MKKLFCNQIKEATEERDIELVYKNNIKLYFKNSQITYPFKCDGYIEEQSIYDEETKVLRLIMEFKYGFDFNDPINVSKVLIQVIFYIKQFQLKRDKKYMDMPNVILVGDKSTCFIISVKDVEKYLKKDLDWDIAPSSAARIYMDLVKELSNAQQENELNPIIFNINNNFRFENVVRDIKRLVYEFKIKFKITTLNIVETYEYFIQQIIIKSGGYSASDLAECFINTIIGEVETSNKKNAYYIAKEEKRFPINWYSFQKFEEEYSTKYSIEDKNDFIAIKDRLTEDTKRRFNGEFFTPTIWVNETHRQIKEVLGENWSSEYIVWDCAWGTGNLTRDHPFDKLYCSTINELDLELGQKYNKNACKFIYDFLNDDEGLLVGKKEKNMKLPKSLYKSLLNNEKILFYINPPFGEGSNGKTRDKKDKKGISNTKVKKKMVLEGLNNSSQQLYIQFLYRILKIKKVFSLDNVSIAIFTPMLFLSGERGENFRKVFFQNFKYEKGIAFKASNFSDVSKEWAVLFSIWTSGKQQKEEFKIDLKELECKGIVDRCKKEVYSLEHDKRLSSWIKNNLKAERKEIITLKSAINYDNKIKKVDKEAIGFLMNDSNNVYANTKGVYILSAPVNRHVKTTIITKENYKKCFSLFAARKLIKSKWYNQIDEYIIPNIEYYKYKEWESDCIVYSIFQECASTSSLRNVRIQEVNYNIFNEMFFMSNEEILELAIKYNNEEIYEDCKMFNKERFIKKELEELEVTTEGGLLLGKARKLIVESFKYREKFNKNNDRYNINAWDAGWYQIKAMLKVYMKEDLLEFNKLFNRLEDKMRPMVYELGFLKK